MWQTINGKRGKHPQSRMPTVLRDLAPEKLDPIALWAAEKAADQQTHIEAAVGGVVDMIGDNIRMKLAQKMLKDWRKLSNLVSNNLGAYALPSEIPQIKSEIRRIETTIGSSLRNGRVLPSNLLSSTLEVLTY